VDARVALPCGSPVGEGGSAPVSPRRRRVGLRWVALAPLLVLSAVLVSGLAEAAWVADPDGRLLITASDPDQRALVDWAVDRFEQAGLALPALTISIHETRSACAGSAGLFYWGPPPRVELCAVETPSGSGARMIVLHELGHAWAELTSDQAARDRFLAVRSLDTWRDSSVPTGRWGQEQAAEILAWGLMDQPVRLARIHDADSDDLAAAFEALAGQPPLMAERLHGVTAEGG